MARLLLVSLSFNAARKHIDVAKVKGGGTEFNLSAHDFCPFVARRVEPANKVQVIDVFKGAKVSALRLVSMSLVDDNPSADPFCRLDRDQAVVLSFLFQNHRMWIPSCAP